MDPNKDLTILATGGGTPERLAAVASGSVDATVITSPAEYAAEKQGLRIIMSARGLDELVRIPITGIGDEPQRWISTNRVVLARASLRDALSPNTATDRFRGSCASMPPGADKLFKLYRAILSLAIDLRIDLCGKFNLDFRP
jgi:hypothetical protein